MATIREYLKTNEGKLYAALPASMVNGKAKAARNIIAEKLGIADNTVYTILTGRGNSFASDETVEKVVAEAIRLLKSTEVLLKEYEVFEAKNADVLVSHEHNEF